VPKKAPRDDAFRPTQIVDGPSGESRYAPGHQHGTGREYPRDIGRDHYIRQTYACRVCGLVARRGLYERHATGGGGPDTYAEGGPKCPNGHGTMKWLGVKLRIPRKAKLLKLLRKKPLPGCW
jgi:hypothetical protein